MKLSTLSRIPLLLTLLTVSSVFALSVSAKDKDSGLANLTHVGLNPAACVGPFSGTPDGHVEIKVIGNTGALTIAIDVHGAQPNKIYDVDVRCVSKIGILETDAAGVGEAEITLLAPPKSPFYIDVSVPNGGGGAGNFGDTFIAGPLDIDPGHPNLTHVGLNPAACVGPFSGTPDGNVEIRVNSNTGALTVAIVVHGAQPNKIYDVDVRCVSKIGILQTDAAGVGEAEITLLAPPKSPFYIDVSVPNGGGGAGNFGDTFIAGPFNLN